MKKDKKIKELDDWLKNSNDEDFHIHDVTEVNENDCENFDYNFEEILLIDNNRGVFEYKRNGVQDYVLNKLRKKSATDIHIEIDLHGETVKDAILKLDNFFSNAFENNVEYIKIICGKGTNSIDNVPKIKITTQAYIKKSSIANAACTARDKDGGVGVIKVKLKN
jgi:DNA-nicking Smr family endonuclease